MKTSEMQIHLLPDSATIREALERINIFSTGQPMVLFLCQDDGRVSGSLTDGDIRRGLLAGAGLDEPAGSVANRNFHFLSDPVLVREIKEFRDSDLRIVPLLDENKKLKDLINFKKTRTVLPVDVVIMAGGKGTRLHPYTRDIPKPLLELGGKPIIAHNIDRLASFGVRNFHVSVNHMKDQIRQFLGDYYLNSELKIEVIEEGEPLGTIGSVALRRDYSHKDVMVINSDVLTNIDFEDFYISFKDRGASMSIAAFDIKIDVPYAVLETEKDRILSFVEKPSYLFRSNAGIYLLDRRAVQRIPVARKYDSIDLMNDLISTGERVIHFPIRGYWLDIGNPQNYRKAQEDIQHIKF